MKAYNREVPCRAAVLGLGLIGGSFAARLRHSRPGWTIVGHDVDEQAMQQAVQERLVDRIEPRRELALESADVVVLATPVGAILETISELARHIHGEAVVIDLGSTKAAIVNAMGELPERIQAVGGHPMTGAVTAGVNGPVHQLFEGRPFVLCPTQRTSAETMVWARALLSDFGADLVELDAMEHDRAVAMVSHLPYLMSIPLLDTFDEAGAAAHQLVAGGFRLRIHGAGDNIPMWEDILRTNRDGIAAALAAYRHHLASLEILIQSGSVSELHDLLAKAAQSAQALLDGM